MVYMSLHKDRHYSLTAMDSYPEHIAPEVKALTTELTRAEHVYENLSKECLLNV